MTFGTWLFTKMRGELVGSDDQGNRYYQDRRVIPGRRRKRWVIYNGEAEASRVPPACPGNSGCLGRRCQPIRRAFW